MGRGRKIHALEVSSNPCIREKTTSTRGGGQGPGRGGRGCAPLPPSAEPTCHPGAPSGATRPGGAAEKSAARAGLPGRGPGRVGGRSPTLGVSRSAAKWHSIPRLLDVPRGRPRGLCWLVVRGGFPGRVRPRGPGSKVSAQPGKLGWCVKSRKDKMIYYPPEDNCY